ncbi:hypothetical protein BGZ83_005304 [Gryganskiella cystojenkinii]|nr:hypothetical protein BGZ83_005304 [Gryganskiella cystojenkinii]
MTSKYWCIFDGETTKKPFSVDIAPAAYVDDLKNAIKKQKANALSDVDAPDLHLWKWSILPIADDRKTAVKVKDLDKDAKLHPKAVLSSLSLDENTYIIIQLLPAFRKRALDLEDMPKNKKIRIIEKWVPYRASDGKVVDIPPLWIDILASTEFVPEPRTAFDHLKGDDLRVGDAIVVPSMGQSPKEFGLHGQPNMLFVTEQMLELWEDMRGDKERTYRRVLSGPMGVGKSYLSYFLVAKAYAEGWPVLYISDARLLGTENEDDSALEMVRRFLALNKDILTGAELEMLVNDYDGTRDISRNALSVIFRSLLMSRDRKALLLVDEHRALFKQKPYLPDKFPSLMPLKEYGWWGEGAKGSRVIFTGTTHAFEMTVLDDCYRIRSVDFVGPLSSIVFSKLMETYPLKDASDDIKKEVTRITNCVPGELVRLAAWAQNSFSEENLQKWTEIRKIEFLSTATLYYNSLDDLWSKEWFYRAFVNMILRISSVIPFHWDFLDLGLIYRRRDSNTLGNHRLILCRPAQRALLELLKTLPLLEETRRRICDGGLSGHDFETALFHQLICTPKPILLNTTDLNGKNPTAIELDFIHYEALQIGQISLGRGREKVLTRGDEDSRRFNYMLGPLFIQVSVSDFGEHEKSGSGVRDAFTKMGQEPNEIENYLDDLYGPSHSATIENNRFVVKRNGVTVDGFHIVYIRGSPADLSSKAGKGIAVPSRISYKQGPLSKNEPYLPDKFASLNPLKKYGWLGEVAKGSLAIFTGSAHAFEMTVLEESYRYRALGGSDLGIIYWSKESSGTRTTF